MYYYSKYCGKINPICEQTPSENNRQFCETSGDVLFSCYKQTDSKVVERIGEFAVSVNERALKPIISIRDMNSQFTITIPELSISSIQTLLNTCPWVTTDMLRVIIEKFNEQNYRIKTDIRNASKYQLIATHAASELDCIHTLPIRVQFVRNRDSTTNKVFRSSFEYTNIDDVMSEFAKTHKACCAGCPAVEYCPHNQNKR